MTRAQLLYKVDSNYNHWSRVIYIKYRIDNGCSVIIRVEKGNIMSDLYIELL